MSFTYRQYSNGRNGILFTRGGRYDETDHITIPEESTYNSHSPVTALSPVIQQLPIWDGEGHHLLPLRHLKPANCIVTWRRNTLRGKHYPPSSTYLSSQMPTMLAWLASLWLIGERESVASLPPTEHAQFCSLGLPDTDDLRSNTFLFCTFPAKNILKYLSI